MTLGKPVLAILAGFLAAGPAMADPTPTLDEAFEAFTGRYDQLMQETGTVGSSLTLVKDGHIVKSHYYGFADRDTGRRVDADTIFHWASITKTFTAVSLMQLRDRKRLKLDDAIVDYLPEVKAVYNPFGRMQDITLRQLISHSAGFRSPTFPWGGDQPWHPFEPHDWSEVAAMMPYTRINFAPGSQYSYSNPGISMLGRVVEIVSGDTIEEYVTKNILMPTGMTRSYFDTTPYHLLPVRSNNYLIEDGKAVAQGLDFDTGATSGNGGLNAPVADMVRWLNVWLGLDAANEGLLARSTFNEMWKPVLKTDDASVDEHVGMVFFTVDFATKPGAKPVRYIGHTGDQLGFTAFVYVDPARKTAVLYNNNTAGNDAFLTRQKVREDVFRTLMPVLAAEKTS